MSCNSCGKKKCCCVKKISSTGKRGPIGPPGRKGDKGDPGEGTSYTTTNYRQETVGWKALSSGTPSVDDSSVNILVTGKYLINYGGEVKIALQGDEGAQIYTHLMVNAVINGYSHTTTTKVTESGIEERWHASAISNIVDLEAGDVVNIQYFTAYVGAQINSTFLGRGILTIVRIA